MAGPLVLESAVLPTVPQPLPILSFRIDNFKQL